MQTTGITKPNSKEYRPKAHAWNQISVTRKPMPLATLKCINNLSKPRLQKAAIKYLQENTQNTMSKES